MRVIAIGRAPERRHERRRCNESWSAFRPQERPDTSADLLAIVDVLNEHRLRPSGRIGHSHHDADVVTYVREGAVAYQDSAGRSSVIHTGEFQCVTGGVGLRHRETNRSRSESAHVFQLCLRPTLAGLPSSVEKKRFSVAQRRGIQCVIASPDGRAGSMRLHLDALLCSAVLDPGQHVIHELSEGRRAWLHVVCGELSVGGVILTTGDGAGISVERAVSFTARLATEVLLLDVGPPPTAALALPPSN